MTESLPLPLRWESIGDQWWYASPIDFAAANGHYDLVRELLRIDNNLIIKLTSLRRIRRLESVWDDDSRLSLAPVSRSKIARNLFRDHEHYLLSSGYGGWLLYTAASAGDFAFVLDLLHRDPLLVFGEGEYGVSDILYAAARSKNSDLFRLLLDFASSPRLTGEVSFGNKSPALTERVNAKFVDPRKFSSSLVEEVKNRAAHAAARGGNLEILIEILSSCDDALILRDANGSTVLHSAAAKNQLQVVEWLIKSTDMIDATDHEGNTAIHVAAFRGQLRVLQAMTAASPPSTAVRNNAGETLFHSAVTGFGANGFRRLDRQMELLRWLVTEGEIKDIVNAVNEEGKTALHVAVAGDLPAEVAELLLTIPEVNLDVEDADGLTALDLLRRRPRSMSTEKMITSVVNAGGRFKSTAQGFRAPAFKLRVPPSPGVEFVVPDNEIFLLFCGDSQRSSSCSSSERRKKESAVISAAKRVKKLIGGSRSKRETTPLRERLYGTTLQGNKRVTARNQASPAYSAGSSSSSSDSSSLGGSSARSKSPSTGVREKEKGFSKVRWMTRKYLCLGGQSTVEGDEGGSGGIFKRATRSPASSS